MEGGEREKGERGGESPHKSALGLVHGGTPKGSNLQRRPWAGAPGRREWGKGILSSGDGGNLQVRLKTGETEEGRS